MFRTRQHREKTVTYLFHDYALRDKERAFALAIWLHAVALTVAVVAIAAGVLGAHGA